MAQEPTIIVRKADGTTERVPLSALKKKPEAVSNSSSTPVPAMPASSLSTPQKALDSKPVLAPVPVTRKNPLVLKPNVESFPKAEEGSVENVSDNVVALPVVTPVQTVEEKKTIQDAVVPVVAKNDFSAPLEELQPSTVYPVTSDSRIDVVEKVIQSLSFTPPAPYLARFKSIIRLRLKDIRTEEEAIETLQKSLDQGGLGFTLLQAQETAGLCAAQLEAGVKPPVQSDTSGVRPLAVKIPLVQEMGATAQKLGLGEAVVDVPVPVKTTAPHSFSNKASLNSAVKADALVMDITSKPVKLTPVEELSYFTLVDWRRLSPQVTEAMVRLQQKFTNLKDESYLLYLEALRVWQKSPLYLQYIQVIDQSLAQHASVASVLGGVGTEKLALEEFLALAKLQHILRP